MGKGKRCTEEQIIKVLGEIEAGGSVASVARSHGITDQTISRWRERYTLIGHHRPPSVDKRMDVVAQPPASGSGSLSLFTTRWDTGD